MSNQVNHLYEFGEFQLDAADRVLRRGQKSVPLTPKAFETLLVLVRRAGRLVEKDELMKQVWADSFVEEANLARNIWTLRKALDDDEREHRYIETVPKLGYRFVAPVTELPNESIDLVIRRKVRAHILSEESSDSSRASVAMDPSPRAEPPILDPKASIRGAPVPGAKAPGWSIRNAGVLLIAAGVFVIIALLVATIVSRRPSSQPAEAIDSIAVMPFVNASSDPDVD